MTTRTRTADQRDRKAANDRQRRRIRRRIEAEILRSLRAGMAGIGEALERMNELPGVRATVRLMTGKGTATKRLDVRAHAFGYFAPCVIRKKGKPLEYSFGFSVEPNGPSVPWWGGH